MTSQHHFIETLPLLKWVVNEWRRKKPLENITVLLIIHLLQDASGFIQALKLLGSKKVTIIGKPYSTLHQSVNEIAELGFNNICVPHSMNECVAFISRSLEDILNCDEKVIILEDGGYCMDIIRRKNLNANNLLGIVEQTTIGITRDIKSIKKLKDKVGYPIINVAGTVSKRELESIEVGNAITRNVQNLLAKMNKSLPGKEVLIVGFGSVGSAVAASMKGNNASVMVHDSDPLRRIKAKYMGFRTGDFNRSLREADMIIGCVGRKWAGKEELGTFKNNEIFVCATSERVGYSHTNLIRSAINISHEEWGIKFLLKNNKRINLLVQGYPVNFYGAIAKESVPTTSVPAEALQIISALLLWGILLLSEKRQKKGLINFPAGVELKLDKKFEEYLLETTR